MSDPLSALQDDNDALHEKIREQADRIEQLEAALRYIADDKTNDLGADPTNWSCAVARRALAGESDDTSGLGRNGT